MGAFHYIRPRLEDISNHTLRYAGRERGSSSAVRQQSAVAPLEQDNLVEAAFGV